MKTVKLMSHYDSTSSGRASTGGWQAEMSGTAQEVAGGLAGGGGAEGCGECFATGGGRGQLQELGSGAGSVTNKPNAPTHPNTPTHSVSTALCRVAATRNATRKL